MTALQKKNHICRDFVHNCGSRARPQRTRACSAPGLADVGRIPCPGVDRRRVCPEHEAALRACVATRAAVARGEQRFRPRTSTSRCALGLSGRFAISMPAMRARLPGRRVHRGHLAPAGRAGVRGVCTARLPSIRCPEHGDVALTPSWASDHVSLRALIRDGNTDQLGDTSAHPSSRDARPPGRSGRARWRTRR
jgi:hypothetical protein